VTERTFFRHFADKREVLFWGAGNLRELFTTTIAAAPEGTAPIDAVAAALAAAAGHFEDRRDGVRQRQAVIDANAELQEREVVKLAALAEAVAEALRARGVTGPAAGLAAQAGIAVFRIAFESWVTADSAKLADLLRESFAELRAVTAGEA
jgi:AcrR family transcriptional regulator